MTTSVLPRVDHPADAREGLSTRRKLGLSALVGVAALVLSTQGSNATFTASASRGHMITTGTPALTLGAVGASTNRLGIDVTNLAPGGSAYRSFDITNTGSQPFTNYTLSVVATTHSALDTDTTNGLHITLQRCSTAWSESGSGSNYTYTCSGTTTTVVASSSIIQSATALAAMNSANPNGVDHLLLTETLPSTADNSFQNISSSVTYTFNAA